MKRGLTGKALSNLFRKPSSICRLKAQNSYAPARLLPDAAGRYQLHWRHDEPHHGFVSNKRSTAIDVLALTIPLFCLVCYSKATSCMRRMSAFWAIHHFRFSAAASEVALIIHNINIENQLFNIEIIYFHFQFDAGCESAIRVDRVR